MNWVHYYKPGMRVGMKSSPSPVSLVPGEFALMQNVRLSNRGLKTRLGCARVGSSPVVDPTPNTKTRRAAKTVALNGTEYQVVVSNSDAGTGVRIHTIDATTGAWTELTASSGQYGATRFSGSTSDFYCIAVVSDPQSQKEYLVVNGLNQNPRVWDGTNLAIHVAIDPPSSRALYPSTPTLPKYFNIKDESANSITNSGANWAASDTGNNPDHYFTIVRNTTTDTNPTVVLTFSSAVDFSACPQLILGWESAYLAWWENVKIEINDGGYTTVWDPTSTTDAYEPVDWDSANDRYAAGFAINHIASGSRNAVTDVKLTWVGKEPASSATMLLYLIAGAGSAQGLCQHAISYLNSASRAESIALVVENVLPEIIANLGGPRIDGLRIPYSDKLYYDYEVSFQNTSTAQKDLGVDTLLIYRNDPGDLSGVYSYVTSVSLATYSAPNWSFASGSALSVRTATDTASAEDKTLSLYAPDAYHRTIPSNGEAMAYGSGRLFVGRRWNGTTFISELWISQLDHPFRFRRDVKYFAAGDIDETSALRNTFPGETFRQVLTTQTDKLDVAGIFIWTDQSLYALSGVTATELSRMRRITPHGTYYPNSCCEDKGRVFWVDTKGDILKYGPEGFQNLSAEQVEGRMSALLGFGGEFQIHACFFKNLYRIAYDTAGATNPASISKTKALVWDDIQQAFTEDDPASTLAFDMWLPSQTKLYVVMSDHYLYEYEKAATTADNGSAFTTKLTGGEIHNDMWTPVHVGHMGIVCDDGASSSWTTTRTFRKDGSTSTGTIDTDVSTNQAWRRDTASPRPGGYGLSCQPDWTSSTYPGGLNIFGLPLEVEGTTWEGDDV